MTLQKYCLALILFVITQFVHAADIEEMKAKLQKLIPAPIDSVKAVGETGLFEVVVNGSDVIYFSEDLSYGFQGSVIAMDSGTNITEAKKKGLRKDLLANLDEAELIVYGPKDTDYTLTVFTDIDCGYCRKMHQQMDEYNALGIRIRYMAFPRTGIDSESFDKAEEVWCAEDRKVAMTNAKNGVNVKSESCDSPVAAQYEFGQKLGVNGTPALYLESGESLPGYVPPKRLKQLLDERALAAAAES